MTELMIDEDIKNKIYTIRDIQVMIDRDLAKLYGVETKVFNQAVKRNIERFPELFRFQLREEEYQNLRSQIVTSSSNDPLRSQSVTLESQNIEVTTYTNSISKQLNLDLQKYNSQYKPIEIKKFENSHDRFLIIDDKELYHIGASLKDLGKKWFAFSKMDIGSFELLKRLKSES